MQLNLCELQIASVKILLSVEMRVKLLSSAEDKGSPLFHLAAVERTRAIGEKRS